MLRVARIADLKPVLEFYGLLRRRGEQRICQALPKCLPTSASSPSASPSLPCPGPRLAHRAAAHGHVPRRPRFATVRQEANHVQVADSSDVFTGLNICFADLTMSA